MENYIDEILSGNKKAIEIFYETYAPKIYKYLKYRLPKHEDIEAYTNDILLEVIDSLPLFQKKSTFTTWIYKIAHNKIVDFYRKKKIKSLLLSQMPFLDIIAHEVYEPEFQFEKDRIRNNIQQTLRKISAEYRQIILLHYEEQKTIKEIACILNVSPKAAESLLFRARQKFKKEYGKE